MEAEDYLKTVEGWKDPWPVPVLEGRDADADGIHKLWIVRDDLLTVGSKVRGLDYLIGHDPENAHVKEWVFGSCPATGYAQISLPAVCEIYHKKAVLFMAERDWTKLTTYQLKGVELGAEYHWVKMGMLNVTQKRARDYVAENPITRKLLPIGLEHPTVIGSFIKVARSLPIDPKYVWTVGSSGTLNRSLQLAWPDAEVHVVSVGHKMSPREIGRAIFHRSPYKFDKPVKHEEMPPYPSAPTYDAKVWKPLLDWRKDKKPKGTILVWNVAA